MIRRLEQYSGYAYALLRIVTGFMFSVHGMQKLFNLPPSDHPMPEFGTLIWIGGLIELVGGLLVMLGLQTRWAAFVSSGQMAVAYIAFHWKFQFGHAFLPSVNQGELAALYCFVFLYIATRGGVKWCLDRTG